MKKLFACVATTLSLLLCGCFVFDGYDKVLKANWGFTLPTEAGYEEIFEEQTEPSFQGDGFRYHVFSCREGQPILTAFSWSHEEEKTIFHDDYSSACEEWLDKIGVSEAHRPVYVECVYWYSSQSDTSEIIMLFSEKQSRLYVVESFL